MRCPTIIKEALSLKLMHRALMKTDANLTRASRQFEKALRRPKSLMRPYKQLVQKDRLRATVAKRLDQAERIGKTIQRRGYPKDYVTSMFDIWAKHGPK